MTGIARDTPRWGAHRGPDGVTFGIWAPSQDRLTLQLEGSDIAMDRTGDGWFTATAPAEDGATYGFRLDDGQLLPDPASRLQAGDVNALSCVVDHAYDWTHPRAVRKWEEVVIYELHTGTFTPEGTFRAAIGRLPHLVELGITAIELMPVSQFGGDRGWGYDGVLLYAPHPAYGTPDDLRALVDAAHGHGIAVLIDVVYNHFGPEGNYLPLLAPDFFDHGRETPWGAAIDYGAQPVRDYYIDNAMMWIEDYGMDGLRLDAIDHIRDHSDPELLVELARVIRARHPETLLTTEDNRNVTHLHEPDDHGPRMDGEWNDDWHNAVHVLLTGETEGYYERYAENTTAILARAMAEGFATEGAGVDQPASAHQPPTAFIDFLQNHDQVGNRAFGERLTVLVDRQRLQVMQAALLLSPHIPMVFMGDEWDETNPFLFFAGFGGDLGNAVKKGRRAEFGKFHGFDTDSVPNPIALSTFEASRIDWDKADTPEGRAAMDRMRGLLTLRRAHIVPRLSGAPAHGGRVHDAPERCLAVDWDLAGAKLQMRVNLTDTPVDLPPATGERIHLTGDAPGAPLSIAVWIAS